MRITHALLSALVTTALLASCASEPDASPGAPSSVEPSAPSAPLSAPATSTAPDPTSPSATPEPSGPTLTISIEGDDISPTGERIDLAPGQTLVVAVTSDRAGELHVHAKPEQYVEFTAGSTTAEIVIDVPGVVEVEDHGTGAVVAQIQVQ